jgi:predicted RNase H-like nuclease
MWVAGVDGCRAGWIVALARTDAVAAPTIRVVSSLEAALAAPERPAVVAIDMPIGLPDRIQGSGRRAEQLVRPLLGGRQSSVFAIPSRSAVHERGYGEACRIAAETSDPPRRVSKQGFMLFPKIREIDALLLSDPALADRLYEVHPELAFWSMNGERALEEPKKVKGQPHGPGLALRRALLARMGLAEACLAGAPPRGAAADDLLDALAGLVVARKIAEGQGRSFPDPPERDAHGLPIAIWTFRSKGQGRPC